MGLFTPSPPCQCHIPSDLVYLDNIHANSILFEDVTFLIKGASGSGKSDLSLRLMAQGAQLIADDRTLIYTDHKDIYVAAHENIKGKIEVRGIGIIDVPTLKMAKCDVILELDSEYPRYPTQKDYIFYKNLLNYYKLNPFENTIIEKLKIITHLIRKNKKDKKNV